MENNDSSASSSTAMLSPTMEDTPPGLPVGNSSTQKGKRRQKILRGIQRISSSPSLLLLSIPRGNSTNPYGDRGSLSCVSFSNSQPGQISVGSPSPKLFPNGQASGLGSPTTELATYEALEARLAVRRAEYDSGGNQTPGSTPLPTDMITMRDRYELTRKAPFELWANLPSEIWIHILWYLRPKELVRVSRVNTAFHRYCFDGQLWTKLDASDFYSAIPADSLAKMIVTAGPFVKDLNLRGCIQIEHYERAEAVVKACKNLFSATLEGCVNIPTATINSLVKTNEKLRHLNFTGLSAITNSTLKIISQHCPRLESLNISWCKKLDARGIKIIVLGCSDLRDLRAREVTGFHSLDVSQAIFRTNKLERLALSGCTELTDEALRTMICGRDPVMDPLTNLPKVPPRKLRHLDLSRCVRLHNHGVEILGHNVPDLEGLQLSGCSAITSAALEPIFATTPKLTHLDLEDLSHIDNDLLSNHLAKSPCAPTLQVLSLSYCEHISEVGMIPVFRNCVSLQRVDMDNTRIGDLALTEAAAMVRSRARRRPVPVKSSCTGAARPSIGLHLAIYDCSAVSWPGIREVLSWNADVRRAQDLSSSSSWSSSRTCFTEVIGLKCYHGWQQTVDQHTKRVLRGDFDAARRLERKWVDYMQAMEDVSAGGAGSRRRRRRARDTQLAHQVEEGSSGLGRRRARTMVGSCSVM